MFHLPSPPFFDHAVQLAGDLHQVSSLRLLAMPHKFARAYKAPSRLHDGLMQGRVSITPNPQILPRQTQLQDFTGCNALKGGCERTGSYR